MTNEKLKKKIISVLQSVEFVTEKGWCGQCISLRLDYSAIADALIAARIGDVSELKKHRVVVEKSLIPEDDNAYVLPNIPPTIKQLYGDEEVEQIVKERDEYKHRAEVAERALQIADELGELCGRKEDYVQQAEKELSEERKDD